MQWRTQRQSDNVEDLTGGGGGGMGRMLPVGGGIGTLILAAIVYFMGGDPSAVLNQNQNPRNAGPNTSVSNGGASQGGASQGGSSQDGTLQNGGSDAEAKQFVSTVLASTEDVWGGLFSQRGLQYHNPKLVLFTNQIQSACGVAGTSSGPFYCPRDQKLYLDLAFFKELDQRFGAPGDFAQAYVIAHEVGHHVQNQLGTLGKVQQLQSQVSEKESNQISVRTELQADFYAGVWAYYAKSKGLLDPGDAEEALTAASGVGDDTIQKAARGYIVPDSFTHGTSAQRMEWFRRGMTTGDMKQGNTFGAAFQ